MQTVPEQLFVVGSKMSAGLFAPSPVKPPVPTPPFSSVKSPVLINVDGMVYADGFASPARVESVVGAEEKQLLPGMWNLPANTE